MDSSFTRLNQEDVVLNPNMELEEAVVVGLLAVGMSALIAVTIMLFW